MLNYKNYIVESNNNEYNKLVRLSLIIKKRYKKPNQKLIIYYIAKVFGYDKILNISSTEYSESYKDIIHSYIVYGKDKFFDGFSFHDKEDILTNHGVGKNEFKSFSFSSRPETLKDSNSNMSEKQTKELVGIITDYFK